MSGDKTFTRVTYTFWAVGHEATNRTLIGAKSRIQLLSGGSPLLGGHSTVECVVALKDARHL